MTDYNEIKNIKAEITALKKVVKENSSAPRLSHSSIHNGGFSEYDAEGNLVSRVGTQHDGTHGAADLYGPKPPEPTAATLAAAPVSLTISWDGRCVDDSGALRPLPLDFQAVQILAKKDGPPAAFGNADLKGVITSEAGGEKSLSVEHGEWHVALRVRTKSGRLSDASDPVIITVPNVVDVGEIEADIAQAQADAAAALSGSSAAEITAAAAQAAADAAADDAANAAADAAVAAGLVADKGKVIIQSAEPAVGDRLPQNLWIDMTGGANTPKRWTGAAWSAVTDKAATDAAANAATALSTANTAAGNATAAQTAAGNALTAANGKNKISYGTSAPTAATPGTPGDVYWVRSGSNITGQYLNTAGTGVATGNTWDAQTLTNATIAALDAGKITTGTIDVGRLGAKTISTDKLLIGSTDNLVDDPNFITLGTANSVWGSTSATVAQDPIGGRAGGTSLRITLDGTTKTVTSEAQWKRVQPNAFFKLSMWVRSSVDINSTDITSHIEQRDSAGVITQLSAISSSESLPSGSWYFVSSNIVGQTSADGVAIRPVVKIASTAGASGQVWVDQVTVIRAASGDLIVDGSIIAGKLAAESVTTENLAAGSVTGQSLAGEVVLGSRITTAETGQRVEMDSSGFRLYNALDELRVNLPTNPSEDPSFRGEVQADGLTVRGGASFFSTLNEFAKDSVISLAEQVAAPISAPQVANFWESAQPAATPFAGALGTFALDPSLVVSGFFQVTNSRLRLVQRAPSGNGSRVWSFSTTGNYLPELTWDLPDAWNVSSIANGSDGEAKIMFEFDGNWWIYDYSLATADKYRKYTRVNTLRDPMLTTDGDNIWVVESMAAGPRFRRVNTTSSASNVTVLEDITSTGAPSGSANVTAFYRGNMDFGSPKFVVSYNGTSTFRVYGSDGVYDSSRSFPSPVSKATGMWDSGVSRWRTFGLDGRFYRHSSMHWTDPALDTWHLAQTFYDGNPAGTGTHETAIGAIRTFSPLKRSWARVTGAQVPFAGGTDDPNNWRIYGKTGAVPPASGTGMTLQYLGSYTAMVRDFGTLLNTDGGAPPAVSNFPNATPARMKSQRTMPGDATKSIFEVRGDGSGRWGNIEVDGTGVVTLGTRATSAITFSNGPTNLSSMAWRRGDTAGVVLRFTKGTVASNTVIATLAPEFWPPWEVTAVLDPAGTTPTHIFVRIGVDGTLTINWYGTDSTAATLRGTATWPVAAA